MKDLSYFIEKEEIYNQQHPQDEFFFNDKFGEFDVRTYPNDLLKGKWISQLATDLTKNTEYVNLHRAGLLDVEIVILYCFMGNLSRYFRDDYYVGCDYIPEEALALQEILDSILRKAPKTESHILYRFLKPEDQRDFKIGDSFTPSYSLTTTNEDWAQDVDAYIITPLANNETNARDIFKFYNHGNENQVNFLKGTSFIITDIEINLTGLKKIYMEEIK